MKKITLAIIFIWLFSFQVAYCGCNITGGACSIEDLVVKPAQLPKLDKKKVIVKPKLPNNQSKLKKEKKVKLPVKK